MKKIATYLLFFFIFSCVSSNEPGSRPRSTYSFGWDDKDFSIGFDHYGSTNSEENKRLCELFYERMKAKNHVHKKPIEQLFCEHDKMFLPDRFVKGTCPKCNSADQYGDSCDVCGATYSPQDLKSPGCSLCGMPSVKKASDHIFFKLKHIFIIIWVIGICNIY